MKRLAFICIALFLPFLSGCGSWRPHCCERKERCDNYGAQLAPAPRPANCCN
ncbi:hypothetical protein KIH39_10875 [Telmatocola sphagniphila]|uniref:Lipoprotein n=1 Tax=Telmatocola sphagniphila TaxID=1123043 RepID=A0A8E6B900_9BACT|nr:hypothetical protein [Telmatocola sphagniphila]QVL34380.1 hypothetical protein KIH39_10875 [Telmatocola sphagniphila]